MSGRLRRCRNAVPAAVVAAGAGWLFQPAQAATVEVAPGQGALARAIAAAAPGDVLDLKPGVHDGPVTIDRSLTLQGEPGATVDGHGRGRTIEVAAPHTTIRRLAVRGSGMALDRMDAAIFVDQQAGGAVVEDNDIEGNLVGVYIHGAPDSVVRHNRIVGKVLAHLNDAGNGVYLWNAPGTQVLDNDISGGRDGIFTNASRANSFRGNVLHGVRFAVHYMYTNDSEVADNVSIGNHAGYVIMYSNHLVIRNNRSEGDRDHGLLFNFANNSDISGNAVRRGEKCVFIYNANNNRFHENRFENCQIGVHFTAGSERNKISGNAFIGNRTQVKYVGTRLLDWSENGRGNYWSDNPAFDLNGDGIADEPYRPNDIVDQIVWRHPAAKLLLNSPAMQAVRWAQSQFPGLHPGGVVDSAALMEPPEVPAARAIERTKADTSAVEARR